MEGVSSEFGVRFAIKHFDGFGENWPCLCAFAHCVLLDSIPTSSSPISSYSSDDFGKERDNTLSSITSCTSLSFKSPSGGSFLSAQSNVNGIIGGFPCRSQISPFISLSSLSVTDSETKEEVEEKYPDENYSYESDSTFASNNASRSSTVKMMEWCELRKRLLYSAHDFGDESSASKSPLSKTTESKHTTSKQSTSPSVDGKSAMEEQPTANRRRPSLSAFFKDLLNQSHDFDDLSEVKTPSKPVAASIPPMAIPNPPAQPRTISTTGVAVARDSLYVYVYCHDFIDELSLPVQEYSDLRVGDWVRTELPRVNGQLVAHNVTRIVSRFVTIPSSDGLLVSCSIRIPPAEEFTQSKRVTSDISRNVLDLNGCVPLDSNHQVVDAVLQYQYIPGQAHGYWVVVRVF